MAVGGVWGKLLHVDLTDGRQWIEEPSDEIYLKLLGGRAMAAWLLLRDLPVGADPLGPENLLIFAPGILQGSNLPGAGRHGVAAKSPLTGAIASAEAGGWWGHEFKRTGHDGLIVHGKSDKPVYLWIKDGEVEIRDAAHLWGKDTADVEWAIQGELDDKRIRVAQCGIAGENLVLYANVINDINRAAGRGGLGAVMGSKNLRAVAVRGNQNIPVTTRKRVTGVSKWLGDNYKTKAASFVAIGTPGGVNNLAAASALPTHNFQDPFFPQHQSISGQLMQETILIGRDTCQACPISCKQVVEHEDQTYPDSPYMRSDFLHKLKLSKEYGGPEYESIAALGSACGVDDFIAIAKANEQTARYGLDSISLGMTIAFVMECVGRGLLTAEQTGGFLPRFGRAADMLQAVEMIAHGEGFGAQMGQGSKRLAAWIGGDAADSLVEVKGQELPMHEPRAKHALGVGYAVAPVGADHMMNMHDTGFAQPGEGLERVAEIKRFPPMAFNDLSHQKMDLFYHEVNRKHMLDSAIICHFLPYYPSHVAEVLGGLTGYDYTPQDLLDVGERAQTLCRLFNLREGFTEEDDRMPRRVMKAFKEGPLAGVEITQEMFLDARNHWYGLMGWTEAGVPTAERLHSLELSQILDGMGLVTA